MLVIVFELIWAGYQRLALPYDPLVLYDCPSPLLVGETGHVRRPHVSYQREVDRFVCSASSRDMRRAE